ncbi:unnamed protein product [Somion occarium]|uniref:Uncharacterized protein n=1 Tax=Somion occarium TaxID=3059160 RepID=A0ABP1CZR6_9APHY
MHSGDSSGDIRRNMTGLLVHTTGTIRASVALLPLLRSENNPLSAESGSFYVDFTLFLLGFTFGKRLGERSPLHGSASWSGQFRMNECNWLLGACICYSAVNWPKNRSFRLSTWLFLSLHTCYLQYTANTVQISASLGVLLFTSWILPNGPVRLVLQIFNLSFDSCTGPCPWRARTPNVELSAMEKGAPQTSSTSLALNLCLSLLTFLVASLASVPSRTVRVLYNKSTGHKRLSKANTSTKISWRPMRQVGLPSFPGRRPLRLPLIGLRRSYGNRGLQATYHDA